MAFPKPAPPSSTSTSAPLHPRVPYVPGWSVPLPWSVRHQQVLSWVGLPVVQNVSPLPGSPTTPVVPAPPDGQENLPSLQDLPEVTPAQAPCPQLGLLGWRYLPPSTCSQLLSLCMARLSTPTLGRVPSLLQSPAPNSTALHGPSWALEGPRDGPPSPQPGMASLFCSPNKCPSPSRGPTQAPLLPQALPDWDSKQSHSHPALGQHCPFAWPTVPGLLSVTLAPSLGRAQTSCPVRIQGMAEW